MTLARKRRKSGRGDGSRKGADGVSAPAASTPAADRSDPGLLRRRIFIAAAIVAALVAIAGFGLHVGNNSGIEDRDASAATFVGSGTCAGCHQAEARLWDASQHKAAMAHATDKTVLGEFNEAAFDYYGVHSRFFRKDGKFMVETDGPDGKLASFEVKYTFGLDPLQQYLVAFPD